MSQNQLEQADLAFIDRVTAEPSQQNDGLASITAKLDKPTYDFLRSKRRKLDGTGKGKSRFEPWGDVLGRIVRDYLGLVQIARKVRQNGQAQPPTAKK